MVFLSLVFVFEPDLTEGLEFKPLFEEDFLALLPKSHPLAQSSSITWHELCSNPFVTLQKTLNCSIFS